MKYLKTAGIALLLPLMIAGCSSNEEPTGVIPEGYKQAVNKAENVEDKLQDAAEQQLEALEDANQ